MLFFVADANDAVRSTNDSLTTPCLTTPHFYTPDLAYTPSSFPEGIRGLLRAAEAPAAGPNRRHQRPRSLRRTVAGRWVSQLTYFPPHSLSTQHIYQLNLSTHPINPLYQRTHFYVISTTL